ANAGRWNESVEEEEKAVASCPTQTEWFRRKVCCGYAFWLAERRLVVHDDAGAEAAYRQATRLNESYADPVLALAKLKLRQGDRDAARPLLFQAITLGANDATTRELLKELETGSSPHALIGPEPSADTATK